MAEAIILPITNEVLVQRPIFLGVLIASSNKIKHSIPNTVLKIPKQEDERHRFVNSYSCSNIKILPNARNEIGYRGIQ
jgi:hypothetical protein